MINFILRCFGFSKTETREKDDFATFFDAKSGEKAKIIKQVMREASAEQREVLKKYQEELAGASRN
jgi:hypothetical protein